MLFDFMARKLLELETTPQVLHEMPGRLRLGVRALKRLSKEQLPLAEHIIRIMESFPVFTEIKLNIPAGSVLIHYNPSLGDTAHIVCFLQAVLRFLWENSGPLSNTPDSRLTQVIERLTAHIRQSTDEQLNFTAAAVPASVWAE